MKRKLAIIGALSAIGRAILDCLAAHGFSSSEIYAVDSCQNVGTVLPFRERLIQTVAMETFDYTSVDLFFLCTPTILAEYRERMAVILLHSSRSYLLHYFPLSAAVRYPDRLQGL